MPYNNISEVVNSFIFLDIKSYENGMNFDILLELLHVQEALPILIYRRTQKKMDKTSLTFCTISQTSRYPSYILTYYIKWANASWTDSMSIVTNFTKIKSTTRPLFLKLSLCCTDSAIHQLLVESMLFAPSTHSYSQVHK